MEYIITNAGEAIDWEAGGSGEARAAQNAQNLLRTRMGEIPYDRQRGFNTRLYDLPAAEFENALMPEIDRVLLWEPCAEALEAKAERQEDGGVLLTVRVNIDLSQE